MSEAQYQKRLQKIERQIKYLTAHMKRIDKDRKRSLKYLRFALEETDSDDSFEEPEPEPEPEPQPEAEPPRIIQLEHEPEAEPKTIPIPLPIIQPVKKNYPPISLDELTEYERKNTFQEINSRFGEWVQSLPKEERQTGFIMTQLREKVSKYFSVSGLTNNGVSKLSSFPLYFRRKKKRVEGGFMNFYYLRNTYIKR